MEQTTNQLPFELCFVPVEMISCVRLFKCLCKGLEFALRPAVFLCPVILRNIKQVLASPLLIFVLVAPVAVRIKVRVLALCNVHGDFYILPNAVLLHLCAHDLHDIRALRQCFVVPVPADFVIVSESVNRHLSCPLY